MALSDLQHAIVKQLRSEGYGRGYVSAFPGMDPKPPYHVSLSVWRRAISDWEPVLPGGFALTADEVVARVHSYPGERIRVNRVEYEVPHE